MTPEQLDEITDKAPELLREKLGELHDRILQAAADELADSQDSETGKPKVRIGCSIIIELNHRTPTCRVKAAVSTKTEVESEPFETRDPNQPELLPS